MARWVTCVLALLVGAAIPGSRPMAQERLVIGFPASPLTVQFAYLAFGDELGFFREESIGIEYSMVTGSAVLLPQVATGRVQLGYANPDFAVIAAARGEPLPVRFVMNWARSHGFEFVVLEGSPIRRLADLRGRKLGVGALTFGNIPLSRAMLANAGVAWNRDVEILPVGTGPAAWRRLETGEIDALNLFVSQHALMEMAGIRIRRLELPEQFRVIFSNGWVASNDVIERNPRAIAGFGRALTRAWLACKENTEGCVRGHWRRYPTEAPPAAREAEQLAIDVRRAMFDARNIDDFGGGPARYGEYPEAIWRRLIEVMHAEGQIQTPNVDVTRLFTNRFVDDFNRFDVAATLAAARAAR